MPTPAKLSWYYQHMNRDVWDLDWVFEQSLVTLPQNGKPTKLLVTGGKIAIFDAVNRADGKYAFSRDLGLQNLVASIDPKTGKKNIKPAFEPKAGRVDLICPSASGARSWPATAIDPKTDILYVPLLDNNCMDYSWGRAGRRQGRGRRHGRAYRRPSETGQRRQIRPHRSDRSQDRARRLVDAPARAGRQFHAGLRRRPGVRRGRATAVSARMTRPPAPFCGKRA